MIKYSATRRTNTNTCKSIVCGIVAFIFIAGTVHASRLDDLIKPVEKNIVFYAGESVEVPVKNVANASDKLAEEIAPIFRLTVGQMLGDIRDILEERYSLEGELIVYTTTSLNNISVTSQDYEMVFINMPARELTSTSRVHFKIVSNGTKIAEYRLNLKLEHWVESYVAKRHFNPGEALFATDFEIKTVDTFKNRYPIVSSTETLDQYEAVGRIVAGKPLYKKNLAIKPVIHRGELVDVIASEGSLSISMKAIALENGNVGDLIRLRNPQSRKEFQAHITHENTLRVFF